MNGHGWRGESGPCHGWLPVRTYPITGSSRMRGSYRYGDDVDTSFPGWTQDQRDPSASGMISSRLKSGQDSFYQHELYRMKPYNRIKIFI
jgi:hypothetical protein